MEKLLKTLLSIDTDDDFTSDSCEKIANILRNQYLDHGTKKLVALLDYMRASFEKEIPERHNPDKVWVGVPYLVNKFQIHKRISIICIINHVLGENYQRDSLTWQESYR